MTQAIPTSVSIAEDEGRPHARSLLVGSRLMLAANGTLQLTFLFAYLYLRANNFGGMWRPDGIGPPAPAIAILVLIVPLATALALAAALRVSAREQPEPFSMVFGVTLLLGLTTVAVRVYQLYNTGWTVASGTYVDISMIWSAVLLAEFIIGALWMVSMFTGHLRRTVPASHAQVQAVFEYWGFVSAVAVAVFALIQFVN